MFSARRQALRKSWSIAPIGWSDMTSFGPVTGNAATGVPQASASNTRMVGMPGSIVV